MDMPDKPLVWLRGEVKTPPSRKTTQRTPARAIADCERRLTHYDRLIREE